MAERREIQTDEKLPVHNLILPRESKGLAETAGADFGGDLAEQATEV